MGRDQFSPASVLTITPTNSEFGVGTNPARREPQKTSTSVPFGSTAIWLPRVPRSPSAIGVGLDQVAPPSVVREKIGTPWESNEGRSIGRLGRPPGELNRSHTA